MKTDVLIVNADVPQPEIIARAATILRRGGLVAFPTETVYGLGANALDTAAVAKIYEAKGRPPTNPLIVHVADKQQATELVASWPEIAERFADRFWPGPLTLILTKRESIPAIVTAGGPTVALRIPAHPVALTLLQAAALPLAAPSANRSSALSPTRAEHVLRDLAGRIDLLLDAGPTPGGLESTVLDLTTTPPRILRPGLVTPAAIEKLVGPIECPHWEATALQQPFRSPGQAGRHYAPRAVLECTTDGSARVAELSRDRRLVGWLTFASMGSQDVADVRTIMMPRDPIVYAARLYAALHELDAHGVERIVVDLPPDTEEWMAVLDRLRRASVRVG